MSGGRVITGAHHAAGEVGYWSAGGTDLHDVLSAPAIWRRLASAAPKKRPPADLARAVATAAAGNPRHLAAVVADFADFIDRLHVLLDSQTYFLHGPLTALGDGFCASIVEHAIKLAPALDRRPPVIQRSTLGDNAGAIGVACRAMEIWTPATAGRRWRA